MKQEYLVMLSGPLIDRNELITKARSPSLFVAGCVAFIGVYLLFHLFRFL
jgi:hypothetical protein